MRYTVFLKHTVFLLPMSILLFSLDAAMSAPVDGQLFTYQSTVTNDANGPLDLDALLNYDDARLGAPIAVVMHAYLGKAAPISENAQRLRDAGFFTISPSLRGSDGSDGVHDSGGVEVYDIYDAVEAVKAQFPDLVDPTNVHITGYSGGGGNVMSAMTKFPDYFNLGSSFFGMSDYGYDPATGWWYQGAAANHKVSLETYIGNPETGGPAILDRYHARASNLASKNNPYSEIYLFVDADEIICPPIHVTSYRDNAVASATFAGEFDNIKVHIGNDEFVDFDGDGVNDPNEKQAWRHHYPDANEQAAAESWYLSRLLDGTVPQPQLNAADELLVAGFVKTKPFEFWLGDGQNAAGQLAYDLSANVKTFALNVLSNDQSVVGRLSVDTQDMSGLVEVSVNGTVVDSFTGGGIYKFNSLQDAQTITLTSVQKVGDFDFDDDVDGADLLLWQRGGSPDPLSTSDLDDWKTNFGLANPLRAVSFAVPEPSSLLILLVGFMIAVPGFCRPCSSR